MSHVDDGYEELLANGSQVTQNAVSEGGIQSGERFIKKEKSWVAKQCPPDGNAAPLTAGQALHRPPEHRSQFKKGDHAIDIMRGSFSIQWLAVTKISFYGKVWKECVVLGHIPYPSPRSRNEDASRNVHQRLSADSDCSGFRTSQAGNQFQNGGLSRAGYSEESGYIALDFAIQLQSEGRKRQKHFLETQVQTSLPPRRKMISLTQMATKAMVTETRSRR